jgi:hypothetical protein
VKLLTFATVGLLLFNATLLTWAGVGMERPWLLVAAGVCVAASVLVVLAWRRYRRILAELPDDRREMKREVESLRELLRNR